MGAGERAWAERGAVRWAAAHMVPRSRSRRLEHRCASAMTTAPAIRWAQWLLKSAAAQSPSTYSVRIDGALCEHVCGDSGRRPG